MLTIEMALQNIENVLKVYRGTREEHDALKDSFNVVLGAVKKGDGSKEKQADLPVAKQPDSLQNEP